MEINTDLMRMQQQLGQTSKLDKRLDDTAQSFESFFVYTIVKEMTSGLDNDPKLGGGGYAEGVWRDMLNENIADEITKSGGIGIADSIREQLIRYQEAAQ